MDKIVSTVPGQGQDWVNHHISGSTFRTFHDQKNSQTWWGGPDRASSQRDKCEEEEFMLEILIVFWVWVLTGEIISHYISIEFNVCNLGLMMVCVLFAETVTRLLVGGGGSGGGCGWWVVISPGMRMLILVMSRLGLDNNRILS